MNRRPQIVIVTAALCGAAVPFATAPFSNSSRPRAARARLAAEPTAESAERRHLRAAADSRKATDMRRASRSAHRRPLAASKPSEHAAKAAHKALTHSAALADLRGRRAPKMSAPKLGGNRALSTYDGGVWDRLAQCESTSRWNYNGSSGFDGGLQFLPSTWQAYGGREYAEYAWQATRAEQIDIARRVLAGQGWGAWPHCSRKLGLRP